MQVIRISATKARNNFFDLLNQVAEGKEFVVEKDKKEVAIMRGTKKTKNKNKGLVKAVKNAAKYFRDYDPKDNPLRRPGAADFLGKWDKDIKLR